MIEVTNLTKHFSGFTAVNALSFQVHTGEVFGLLGPNGAGKTTTLRVLATLLKPDSGTASVAGHDVTKHPETVRNLIGVVNGGMGLYERLTGTEILEYFGSLYGMRKQAVRTRVKALDALLGLGDALTKPAGSFSTGMRQKITIARAVLHEPPVLFFDEATNGLDIIARRAVLEFVKHYAAAGNTIIYSTHVLSEITQLSERVGILYRGELLTQGHPQDVLLQTGTRTLDDAFFTLVSQHDKRHITS